MRNRPDHWRKPTRAQTREVLVWLAIVALIVLLMASGTFGGPQECKSSVCRTSTANAIGSGVCYGRAANGDVLVLTARHCVRHFNVTCEFFLGSPYAVKTNGEVVAVSSNRDLAVVRIPASEFNGQFPSGVPVADMPPEIGSKIHTVGCPRGAKPTALAGKVLGYPSPRDMTFSPAPVGGRSGSAIFDAEGDEIVGILTNRRWTGGMPVHGLAESTEALGGFFGTGSTQATEAVPGETEEVLFGFFRRRRGGCNPGGGCDPGGGGEGGPIGNHAPSPEWEGPGLPAEEIADDPAEPETPLPVAPITDPVPGCDDALANLQRQIDELRAAQLTAEQIAEAVTEAMPDPVEAPSLDDVVNGVMTRLEGHTHPQYETPTLEQIVTRVLEELPPDDDPLFYVSHRNPDTGEIIPQLDPSTGESHTVQPINRGDDWTIYFHSAN